MKVETLKNAVITTGRFDSIPGAFYRQRTFSGSPKIG
jgi:hypothetical protein